MRRSLERLRWAGFAWLAALTPFVGHAQSAPPATSIEIEEEDVEVVAQPAPPPTSPSAAPAAAPAAPEIATPRSAAPAAPETALPPSTAPAAAPIPPPPSAAGTAAATPAPAPAPVQQAAAASKPDAAQPSAGVEDPWLGIRWSAYVQAQYEGSQRSEDQLQQGGEPLNRNRFVVRRARLRLQRDWDYAALDVELDANTIRDVSVGLRRAAGAVFWPGAEPDAVPYVRAQAGLLDIPFGAELPAGARRRLFAERSTASLAMFPSESDVGATVDGGYGPLRYALAIMNGFESDGTFRVRDPNSAKDIFARVGVELAPVEIVRVLAGISFVEGTGFHPGSDATKNTLEWNDINEDGSKTDAEVSGEPGHAAEPSKNFDRWAVNFDASVGLRTALGWSWLYGEVSLAQNLDRGLFVADPVASSLDSRELGYYIAWVQEVTPYAVVGFRADYYDGNSDFIEHRHGGAFKQPKSVRTYSPVVGIVLPGRARLTFQYDFVDDTLGRDRRGEPADLQNDQWTLRLQVGL